MSPRSVRPTLPEGFDPDAPGTEHDGIYGLPFRREEAAAVVVPVPFDATTSYGQGAAEGPAAIYRASFQVDLHDPQTGDPFRRGIAMEPVPDAIRRWNREARRQVAAVRGGGDAGAGQAAARAKVDGLCDRMNRWVHERAAALLEAGKLPATLGGDHSAAYGAIRASAAAHPGLGVLHVDAHADLREAYEGFTWSHASIMHNVITRVPEVAKLVQVGLRDVGAAEDRRIRASRGRIRAYFDADLAREIAEGRPFGVLARRIVRALPRQVHVSFDIDGLDPALCPGTGTPVPGGLGWHQALLLVETVVRSGRRIVGLDLCEVAPSPVGDEWDANVGARLLYKLIGFALASGKGRRRPAG